MGFSGGSSQYVFPAPIAVQFRNRNFAQYIHLAALVEPQLQHCFVLGLGHLMDYNATYANAVNSISLRTHLFAGCTCEWLNLLVCAMLHERCSCSGNDVTQLLNDQHGFAVRYVPAEENICATILDSQIDQAEAGVSTLTLAAIVDGTAGGDPWLPDGNPPINPPG